MSNEFKAMTDEPKTVKEDKHRAILAAIDRLSVEKNKYWSLVERIQGTAGIPKEAPSDTTGLLPLPSLANFLDNEATNRINDLTSAFVEIREELDRLLF